MRMNATFSLETLIILSQARILKLDSEANENGKS